MHILICVYFRAAFGGLHANIFSTARHCVRKGHRVTVVCPDGPFRAQLEDAGIRTIVTDFTSVDASARTILEQPARDWDVVHAHPFVARKVALEVAKELSLPVILTYHGMYDDEIATHIQRHAAVIAVSEGIRDYLANLIPDERARLHVAPNGVDLTLFRCCSEPNGATPAAGQRTTISLVSRLDKDKRLIIEFLLKAMRHCAQAYPGQMRWNIVGAGTELASLRAEAEEIARAADHELHFSGWLEDEQLAEAYRSSDVVIAPGRCALEAMACGRCVIAVGSNEYVGLITPETWHRGAYSNFGGLGNGMQGYVHGSIERDLAEVVQRPERRRTLGELGIRVARGFYDELAINDRLLVLYELCAASEARREPSVTHPSDYIAVDKGREKSLVVFSHRGAGGFSLYKFLEDFPLNRLFVRDPQSGWYNGHLHGLGDDPEQVAASIARTVQTFPTSKWRGALGSSMGAYAALLYGCLLGFDSILAFSPQTLLDPIFPLSPDPKLPCRVPDLVPVVASATTTRIDLVCGEDDVVDLFYASRLAKFPHVKVSTVQGADHLVLAWLYKQNLLGDILYDWVEDHRPACFQPAEVLQDAAIVSALQRAVPAFHRAEYRDAVEAFTPIVTRKPEWVGLKCMFGRTLLKAGEPRRAEEELRDAMELSPELPEPPRYLARALMAQGHLGQALTYLRRSVELLPDWAEAYYDMGDCHARNGDMAAAQAAFARAAAAKPQWELPKRRLSEILENAR